MNHVKGVQCVEDINCSIRQATQNSFDSKLPIAATVNNRPETVKSQDVFKLEVLLINVLKIFFPV